MKLKIGLVDANEGCRADNLEAITSIVGRWLKWEFDREGLSFHADPAVCDVILLAYAGNIRWVQMCGQALRRYKIESSRVKRGEKPFVITGGTVSTIPFLVAETADVLVLGEGYEFVRELIKIIKSGGSVGDIKRYVSGYESAILSSELPERDPEQLWMLKDVPKRKYIPSTKIDWDVPPVKGDDHVIRVIGSKGCKGKCLFCMTSWSQPYQETPDPDLTLRRLHELAKIHRVQLLTNDVGRLSFASKIKVRLESQSLSVAGIKAGLGLEHIARYKIGIARFGVEGVSERLRTAVMKPIPNALVLDILEKASRLRVGSGLFYISGLPFETDKDWDEYRDIYRQIAQTVTFGICRIKLTAYTPSPPSPLGRFVGEFAAADQRVADFIVWVAENCASRHLLLMQGSRGKSRIRNVAEGLGVPDSAVDINYEGVRDLIPKRKDAKRAVWEIIQWKRTPEASWDLAERYREKLLDASI